VAEAVRLFKLAVAQGHALAQLSLGRCHLEGDGVRADVAEAARFYWMAADRGLALAAEALEELSSERAYVSVRCMGCGATRGLKTCSKCKMAKFCGAECARRAWPAHKPHCKRWVAEADAGGRP
jgi:hypothetical protein